MRLEEFFADSFEVGAFAEDSFELEATFFPDFVDDFIVLEATATFVDGVFLFNATSID